MDINFELYKVFFYVATEKSFSNAAKKLYISQSAVSQSIKALEEKLGTTLFVRHRKNIRLTNEGETLYQHVEPAFHLLTTGEDKLKEFHDFQRGVVHIAVNDTICKYYLLGFLKHYAEAFPGIKVQITNRTSYGCMTMLDEGKVDFILTYIPNAYVSSDMSITPLLGFRDELIYHERFQGELDKGDMEVLDDIPWIMLKQGTSTRKFMDQHLNKHQINPTVDIELTSIDLIKDLVSIGLGVSCVPDFSITESDINLKTLPLTDIMPERQIALITNPRLPMSLASEAFISLLKAKIQEK